MPIIETIRSFITSQRVTSRPEGAFIVKPGLDVYAILAEAEQWKGSTVVFYPGSYTLDREFSFFNIGRIIGFGKHATKFVRPVDVTLFKSVWLYANIDAGPEIGGFQVKNLVECQTPAIELGGSQNLKVTDIYSWGECSDLLYLTNAEPEASPPVGRPFGTWTENAFISDIVIYGATNGGIVTRVLDPNRRFQSFSYLHIQAQITLTKKNSIGCWFRDHSLVYGGDLDLKFNIDSSCLGVADCFNLEDETQLVGNKYQCFVEGAGTRVKMASSARMDGWGRFYRQSASVTPDALTPGVDWMGRPAGVVQAGILADQ